MSEDQEIEFETPLEEEVEAIDISAQTRTVYTDGADPEVSSLHGKAKRGKLVVQPDFQRHFVWDSKKASRLIESALLSIPIPIIYISEEPDNKEYVIDGQQRLTSFFSFLDGKFPDGGDFRLTGLNVFKELNGKKYDSLPEKLQDTIQYFKLRTVTFKRDSDPDLKFEIFERLNTGSVQLNDQELRNPGTQHIEYRVHNLAIVSAGALPTLRHQRLKKSPFVIAQIKSHDAPPRTVNHVRSNYSIRYLGTDPSITVARLLCSALAERAPGELYARVTRR